MYKTIIEQKGIHGMGYGYFLTKVFKYFNIPLSVGKVGTVKQASSENTLVECECIKGKENPKSKMAQLIENQDQLKHEVKELTMRLSGKDAEIAILKADLLTADRGTWYFYGSSPGKGKCRAKGQGYCFARKLN